MRSLLYTHVCLVFSDRLLKWSKKDGFYTSFRATGGLKSTFNCYPKSGGVFKVPLIYTLLNIKDMKKLFILTICMVSFGIFCVQAQDKSNKIEIPAATKSAFEAKYPNAEKVSWGVEKPGEFEAEFQLNGVESSALFDSKGQFLESETEIKESELPQAIKSTIAKDFVGYKINEVEESSDAKGVVTYEMEASKGKEKFEISFDANGKLLKKMEAKEEGKEKK